MKMNVSGMRRVAKQEDGIISIFTATMLILVLSLVVLGLAQISRREQRVSLDNQLSSQAFYAAESGVNDAVAAIKTKLASGGGIAYKNSCGPTSDYPKLDAARAKLDGDNVKYSCLLINPNPDVVKATLTSNPSVLALTPATPGSLNTLTLVWDPPSGSPANSSGCPGGTNGISDLPPKSSWSCSYGIVRVDLVKTDSGVTRQDLRDNSVTMFLVPSSTGNTVSYSDLRLTNSNNGKVVSANCSGAFCTADISVQPGNYYMKATSIYRSDFELRVSSNGGAGNFVNSQVVIDSTGKAQDVLRRIAVNLNLIGGSPSLVSAALISGDSVCKKFTVFNGYYSAPNSIAGGGGNPMCDTVGGAAGGDVDNGDDGQISGCPSTGCGSGGSHTSFPQWGVNRYIRVVPSQPIASCTWIWGDGSPERTEPASNCELDDKGYHGYTPRVDSSGDPICTTYQIRLRWNFVGGGTFFSNIKPADVPWGDGGYCG